MMDRSILDRAITSQELEKIAWLRTLPRKRKKAESRKACFPSKRSKRGRQTRKRIKRLALALSKAFTDDITRCMQRKGFARRFLELRTYVFTDAELQEHEDRRAARLRRHEENAESHQDHYKTVLMPDQKFWKQDTITRGTK